jgi:7-cyano-7-deazaguanine reductase
MSELTRTDNKVAGKHLGQKSEYSEVYDPTLLVAVPRKPNRDNIGVDGKNTPWRYAYDVWNCYEVSSLLSNGQPFTGVGKLVYDGNSECIVESKSLKLYLNSFNQTRQPADTVYVGYQVLKEVIENDLSKLLNTPVKFQIFDARPNAIENRYGRQNAEIYLQNDYTSLTRAWNLDDPEFCNGSAETKYSTYTHDKSYLKDTIDVRDPFAFKLVHTSNLFSRCQITNQPDHGDLFIGYSCEGKDFENDYSLMQYVATLRGHSCFHEPTVETIFKEVHDALNPRELLVVALYTRRGGISIAPVRATHEHLVPFNLVNHRVPHVKLARE